MTSVTIRRLGPADTEAAARIPREAHDDRLPRLARHRPEERRLFLSDPDLPGVLVLRDGWVDQRHGIPRHQRRGIGAAFLACSKTAALRLRFSTFQRNDAARVFSARRGFRLVEETGGARKAPGEHHALYLREAAP